MVQVTACEEGNATSRTINQPEVCAIIQTLYNSNKMSNHISIMLHSVRGTVRLGSKDSCSALIFILLILYVSLSCSILIFILLILSVSLCLICYIASEPGHQISY